MTVRIGPLDCEDGTRLSNVRQHVTCYGDRRAPAVLVAHALTGNSRAAEWWAPLFEPGGPLDPRRYFVIGINALGSCYGSTGPGNAQSFGRVTVADIVQAQARALESLGIGKLHLVIGGSLGGMQALQWALAHPQRVERAVIVGAHDHHSAMGVALNALQREAIALDDRRGLRLARKIAILSYKSDELLRARHGRRTDRHGRFRFDVEGYLDHQADLFESRMDARSYVALTHAMDSFDVRGLEPVDTSPELHFVGISSDWLFRPQDVRAAAERFSSLGYRASYRELPSEHGHDAFLAEAAELGELLRVARTQPY